MQSTEIWIPKSGDRVKVVSLAPVEATKKRVDLLHLLADLRLSDEGFIKNGLMYANGVFEVYFNRVRRTVYCNREMVVPYDEVRVDLKGVGSRAIVYDHRGGENWQAQYGSGSEILGRIADRMCWRSKSYIDTEHEFPVTEVWREDS